MNKRVKHALGVVSLLTVPLTLWAYTDTVLDISGYGQIGGSNTAGTLAVGYNHFMSAQRSAAVGYALQLYNSDAMSVGYYGTATYAPTIFTVGNGTSNTLRKTAFRIDDDDDDNVYMYGTTQIGSVIIKGTISSTVTFTPTWWSNPSYNIFKSPVGVGTNASPANVGQLKNVAAKAKTYLDAALSAWGGAGGEVNILSSFPNVDNYAPLTVGQLKNVGKVFHDRLRLLGYNWQLPTTAGTTPTQIYPWTGTTHAGNAAPASIGQIKKVFGFEVSAAVLTDSDGDFMLDGWEMINFGNLAKTGTLDTDGDGLTDREEFELGLNPSVSESGTAAARANYVYDSVGRLTNAASPQGSTVFTPDEEGNILNAN